MKRIDDAELIRQIMSEAKIETLFSAPGLRFHLRQYQKGEFLCSPAAPLDHFLLLVRGSVYIYDLQDDGNRRSISLQNRMEVLLFGDMEFATGESTFFFSEAIDDTLCLALPMAEYAAALWEDSVFLRYLVRALGQKLVRIDISAPTVEERVLHLMKRAGGELCVANIEETAIRLRCSSRQLLRVLKKLCANGTLRKEGRGRYICGKV